jgi:hypothetical protein
MLFHVLAAAFAVYTAIDHSNLMVGIGVWSLLVVVRLIARVLVL